MASETRQNNIYSFGVRLDPNDKSWLNNPPAYWNNDKQANAFEINCVNPENTASIGTTRLKLTLTKPKQKLFTAEVTVKDNTGTLTKVTRTSNYGLANQPAYYYALDTYPEDINRIEVSLVKAENDEKIQLDGATILVDALGTVVTTAVPGSPAESAANTVTACTAKSMLADSVPVMFIDGKTSNNCGDGKLGLRIGDTNTGTGFKANADYTITYGKTDEGSGKIQETRHGIWSCAFCGFRGKHCGRN